MYRGNAGIFQFASDENGICYAGISSASVSAAVFFCCAGDLHYRTSAYGSVASGGCGSLWASVFCATGSL